MVRFDLRTRPDPVLPGPGWAGTTAVVTDSAAALPQEWTSPDGPAAAVTVVPMPIIISGRHYDEGSDSIVKPLSVALAEGADVRTSRPAPGHFQSLYRRLEREGAEEIVSVHLSGSLSGTVDAARWAARTVSVPVHVVDSRTVAMAQGYGVASAVLALRNGATAQEAARAAAEACAGTRLLCYVPTLDQLRRGGRVSAAAGFFGALLAVKPLLTVRDGMIAPLESVRTAPRAQARLFDLVSEELGKRPEGSIAAFHYFGNETQVRAASKRFAAGVHTVRTQLPAVLAAHTGLGVMAVAVCDPLPGPDAPTSPPEDS